MLNSSTTLFVVAAIFLVLPLIVWLSLSGNRNRAVLFWCAGSLMAAAGILLMGLRASVPGWLSFHVANTLLMSSLVFWSQGLRCFRGQKWGWGLLVFWVLLFGSFYSVLFAWYAPGVRGMGVRLALGGLALWTAYEALRTAKTLRTLNAYPIAAAFALLGLAFMVQVLTTGGGGVIPSPFSNTWNASALAMVALVAAVISHFSFVGMVIDLALRTVLKQRTDMLALEQAEKLDSQLMSLERQRRLVLVSGALAHELNQPLTVAMTNAQLMQRMVKGGKMPSEMMIEMLTKMSLSLDRASQILTRIREIKPISADGVHTETLDLRTIIQQSLEQSQLDLEKSHVNVQKLISAEPLWCKVDGVSASQIFVNVIRNAAQAMRDIPDAALTITCQAAADKVWVEIADTGPGLPPDMLDSVGRPFNTTRPEGLGLGLAISRTLAQQFGGVLEIGNRPSGVGAIVTLTLPKVECPMTQEQTHDAV